MLLNIYFLFLLGVAIAEPSTLSIPSDDKWLGYDGSWSPVAIQIGTPAQALSFLPSTSGQETVAVGLNGCDGTLACRSLRGGLFESNSSTTFKGLGDYDLGLAPNLGLDNAAYYGSDKISFSNSISENNQLVAIVNDTTYWNGLFGLGIDNTTIGIQQTTSFLSTLFSQGQIPSQSFGYTAGASYQLKQVPASLTLGGYDLHRFEPNDASFTLSSDALPVLAVNSISLDGPEKAILLNQSEQALFTIDSTTPFLWLPGSVVDKFSAELGLIYSDLLQVLIYPSDTHWKETRAKNLSLSFELAEIPGQSTKVTLRLSGDALTSHNLTYGFPKLDIDTSESVPYLPIRKAMNDTQFTLGRTFLQENYLTVDYDRNNFSISQAKFALDAAVNLNLVDIVSPGSTSSEQSPVATNNGSSGLSKGTIIGISVGVVALVVAIAILTLLAILLHRRRSPMAKSSVSESSSQSEPPPRKGIAGLFLRRREGAKVAELAAREHDPGTRARSERRAQKRAAEGDPESEIKELPAPLATMVELPGSPVPERRSSTAKVGLHEPDGVGEEQVPSYQSMTEGSTLHSDGVSMPSPGMMQFVDSPSGTGNFGPSPESTNAHTVSSLSSLGNHISQQRSMSTRSKRPTYTLDDSQTFELKPPGWNPTLHSSNSRESSRAEQGAPSPGLNSESLIGQTSTKQTLAIDSLASSDSASERELEIMTDHIPEMTRAEALEADGKASATL